MSANAVDLGAGADKTIAEIEDGHGIEDGNWTITDHGDEFNTADHAIVQKIPDEEGGVLTKTK